METHGKKYEFDPNFKGPLQKRSCTDIFCLMIFVVFLIAWAIVGTYAFVKGDIETVINPTSTEGRKCGVDSEVKSKPFLMFFNLDECLSFTSCSVQSVCIDKCPEENFIYSIMSNTASLDAVKSKLICKLDVDISLVTTWDELNALMDKNKCAKWYLKSQNVLNRCLPINAWVEYQNMTMTEEHLDKAKYVIEILAYLERYTKYTIEDIKATWEGIVTIIALSGVVSIGVIALLKYIATPIVYLSILLLCSVLSYGIYESHRMYLKTASSISLFGIIACSVVLAIIVLCTITLSRRIYLACQIIKESSKAVTSTISSIIFPIFPWAAQIAVVLFAITVALLLTSVGNSIYQVEVTVPGKCVCPGSLSYDQGAECDAQIFNEKCVENAGRCVSAGCHLVELRKPEYVKYMHGINAFGLFWLFFFISALGQMILAATFSTWYWTFRKIDVPFFTVSVSIWRTFRYHIGTLAFGSLVITICNLIRIFLSWLSHTLKKHGNNQFAQGILTCCKCCFWMLDRFLKYMNRNAYIMCAIHGTSLCQSARDAFNLIVRNVVRVIVLDKITDYLLILGKLSITGLAAFVTWVLYEKYQMTDINTPVVPVVAVIIGTYLVASVFFSVYSAAIDTIFLCFLEDSERNDGSEQRPYFMSKRLRKLLHR